MLSTTVSQHFIIQQIIDAVIILKHWVAMHEVYALASGSYETLSNVPVCTLALRFKVCLRFAFRACQELSPALEMSFAEGFYACCVLACTYLRKDEYG